MKKQKSNGIRVGKVEEKSYHYYYIDGLMQVGEWEQIILAIMEMGGRMMVF